MLPIATATDLGGIRIGTGLQSAADGTLSVSDQLSLYFNDLIFGMHATWIVTTGGAISTGVNPGIALLEIGPTQPISIDIYYLDNKTVNSEKAPKVGAITFPAGSASVTGTITFNTSVAMEPGNVLGLRSPTPTDRQAKGLRLIISVSQG